VVRAVNFLARLAVAGILLSAVPIGGGFAAPTPKIALTEVITPAERCDSLEKQFDKALPKHADAKNLAAAKKLRAEGERRCDAGKHAAGALALARALTELGVDVVEDK
jgi:hypothetical protein